METPLTTVSMKPTKHQKVSTSFSITASNGASRSLIPCTYPVREGEREGGREGGVYLLFFLLSVYKFVRSFVCLLSC